MRKQVDPIIDRYRGDRTAIVAILHEINAAFRYLPREALEREGVEVYTYPGEEITIKGGGGPTCLTRPLVRG